MKQESLDKTLSAILLVLDEIDIDSVDRAELTINLYHLLRDRDEYTKKIEVLQKSEENSFIKKLRR